MICENCKNHIDENCKICPRCNFIIPEKTKKIKEEIIIEQPIVKQLIEEEHKAKETKNERKIILTTISILFFGLSIATIIIANLMPNEQGQPLVVPNPTIKPLEKKEIKTVEYDGYSIGYLSDYEASIENGLLLLEGTDLYFQIKIHSNIAEESYNQNKENLKQKLNNSGFTIKNEESTIRSGIEFEQMELSLLIDGEKEEYEYFITLQDDTLFEILVYEVGNGNYAKISSQLRTIVKNTKSIK